MNKWDEDYWDDLYFDENGRHGTAPSHPWLELKARVFLLYKYFGPFVLIAMLFDEKEHPYGAVAWVLLLAMTIYSWVRLAKK